MKDYMLQKKNGTLDETIYFVNVCKLCEIIYNASPMFRDKNKKHLKNSNLREKRLK